MRIETSIILQALRFIMRPVVKFCLRHSLRIQDFIEVGKSLFVELASAQLEQQHSSATLSALSVMTGLQRREVVRLKNGDMVLDKALDVVSKVIGQWQSDRRFLDHRGEPKKLSYGSEKSEFSRLVYLVSKDVSASSVLSELMRIQSVEQSEQVVQLIGGTYVPKGDPVGNFKILSDDLEDLELAVEANVLSNPTPPQMHFRTVYDRIDVDAMPKIRDWLLQQGNELHLKARQYLARYDLDITPRTSNSDKSGRVVLSSFSLVSETDLK